MSNFDRGKVNRGTTYPAWPIHRRPPAGSDSVLGAPGPGPCSELVLLQW
jgi:hypothetical protein